MDSRKIIHVDMDAFYASVEVLDHSEFEGLPLIVGGSPQSRAVVCSASYPARKFGIKSAMPCAQAQRLCPSAIFLPPRFERYREVSRKVHDIFHQYSALVEPLSLDEAWLDVTENFFECPSATLIARQIKEDVQTELGLTCSAGVSFNKFLAKIASDERKPNGLFVIPPNEAAEFLATLEVRKIPGVGRVTHEKLLKMGIERGADLLAQPEEMLVHHFGKMGFYLYRIARGIDDRPVITEYERKSLGIERTFSADLALGSRLLKEFRELVDGLYERARKKDEWGRTLTVKVKFADFQTLTRALSRPEPFQDKELIRRAGREKLQEIWDAESRGRKIRLLGLSFSQLQGGREEGLPRQMSFFDSLGLSNAA